MRKYIFLIFVVSFITGSCLNALAVPQVNWMEKTETVHQTIIDIHCTEIPAHKLDFKGQRLDLFLKEADAKNFIGNLPEDGRIVKILMAGQKTGVLFSFVLRNKPDAVNVLTDNRMKKLTVEINWKYSREQVQPQIQFGEIGRPKLSSGKGAAMTVGKSIYSTDWLCFFKEYEKDWSPTPSIRFTLADLPALSFSQETLDQLPPQLVAALTCFQQGAWPEAQDQIKQVDIDQLQQESLKPYLLVKGEIELRLEEWQSAAAALNAYQKLGRDPVLRARADFLSELAQAQAGKTFDILQKLSNETNLLASRKTFSFHRGLLLAELYLATTQPDLALATLKKLQEEYPGRMDKVLALRHADANVMLGHYDQAIKQYEQLEAYPFLMRSHPFSQALYARCLYSKKEWLTAAREYIELASGLGEKAQIGMALYASAHCEWRRNQGEAVLIRLRDIQKEFAGLEASLRAQAKLLDIEVIQGKAGDMLAAAGRYNQIAQQSQDRSLREEVLFKQALVAYFLNELEESHSYLQDFVRQNRSSSLFVEAQTLEGQILPRLLDGYLKNGDFLKATVLVEQSRDTLIAQGISTSVLIDTAEAFRAFGFLDRAENIYLFLLDSFSGQPEEEQFYAPLIQVLLEKGEYSGAINFANAFIDKFPNCKDYSQVCLKRVNALYRKPDKESLVKVLTLMQTQVSPELDAFAGEFFRQEGDLEKAEKFLLRAIEGRKIDEIDPAFLAVTAEVLYTRGQFRKALGLYEQLIKKQEFFDQALYRSAQIYRLSGRSDKAVNLLQRLAEEGSSKQWKTMAGELLGMENALKN